MTASTQDKSGTARRLPKEARRQQLLETALRIVRDDGADRLTLGHLAERAGVTKPVAYNHFGTRSGLLIALYRALDAEHAAALRRSLAESGSTFEGAAAILARAYIHCSADSGGELQAVGAALAGSAEMAAVYQELLDGYVELFATTLAPYSVATPAELELRCVGLIGAAEALTSAMIRGQCNESVAADCLESLIISEGSIRTGSSARGR